MLKNTRLQMIAMLAIGGLLGYVVASGNLDVFRKASAEPSKSTVGRISNPSYQEGSPVKAAAGTCCIGCGTKGQLLALADPKPKAGVTNPQANSKKPNILIIWGDDIGWFNISAYNQGMMGYKTPNIDRIAKEGALFTDWYGQQSCTAGRAAFLTGQSPIRTGLTKVGLPGAKEGLTKLDPTIPELLKPLGYTSGQFGKNHLGDLDEHLPTNHGFDEFFGNLYHLNAEEEPENVDYPKDPAFRKKFGPRGVIHSFANADGTQRIQDTGPLTKKRMETIDEEFLRRTTSRSSAGSTPAACTSGRTSRKSPKARPASAFMRTAWWSTTGMWASFSNCWTTSAWPRTLSSCIPPTTARRS